MALEKDTGDAVDKVRQLSTGFNKAVRAVRLRKRQPR
jgi:hypothetical protein